MSRERDVIWSRSLYDQTGWQPLFQVSEVWIMENRR